VRETLLKALEAEQRNLHDQEIKLSFQAGRVEGFQRALKLLDSPLVAEVQTSVPTPEPVPEPKVEEPAQTSEDLGKGQQTSAKVEKTSRQRGRVAGVDVTKLKEQRRQQIRDLLAKAPATQAELCRKLNIPDNSIQGVLACDWFVRNPDNKLWSLSPNYKADSPPEQKADPTPAPTKQRRPRYEGPEQDAWDLAKRRAIADFVSLDPIGSRPLSLIAAHLEMSDQGVMPYLAHHWFEKDQVTYRWKLTDHAWNEYLKPKAKEQLL